MTMIELPVTTRSLKIVQEQVMGETKESGFTFHHEVKPCLGEVGPGTRRSIAVSPEEVHGVQHLEARRVGAQFRRGSDYAWCPMGSRVEAYELRSQILLADGKWIPIDLEYNALLVLLAAHVKIDRSAMPAPQVTP